MKGRVKNVMMNLVSAKSLAMITLSLLLSGCAGWLPSSGPSVSEVRDAAESPRLSGIQLVDLNDSVARRLLAQRKQELFSEKLGVGKPAAWIIGTGDVVEVSIWEAPPGTLFSSSALETKSGPASSRVTPFPEQMVDSDGLITIPFAGKIRAGGRTPQQVEAEVAERLRGLANQPQVLVRVLRNTHATVTVVGEVATSARMPLTPGGERLLDALAASGGVRQPVNKMTIQVTRGDSVQSMPLEMVIRDPRQNITLQPGDVVTALHQPSSFTLLGATGKNEEINFEAQGISLAQALARGGGLQDTRANAQGVFVFRLESADALDWPSKPAQTTPDGKVPVIYRADLKDPATFFVAQSFPVNNKDVLYVANAPSVELQKFLNIIMTLAYPVINVIPLTR
ncbi:polysaccharide export outer membrane protein [Trichlorobacter thiogenes]|uniref:Polysaccharide export outer membrane protein n=2 Tax=Trichlorobacter thiogenes TaxID=115783 RepID=A0A1T4QGS8_9BACT|nr:polysaccharide export outer membrane protein [Trichlorobacter thiogenes]